tara:strand:- start:593 stop:1051 length:459 start_codon:yes stop_codon:yes gene_type:complete
MELLKKILIFIFLFTNIAKADFILPNANFEPFDVIKIQLDALKNNNQPEKDNGIEQTWIFAHPINKIYTGPLERFKVMLRSESYKHLINHQSHEIKLIDYKEDKYIYDVIILSDKKTIYSFNWILEKGDEKNCSNCWFTSSVSRPVNMGNSI